MNTTIEKNTIDLTKVSAAQLEALWEEKKLQEHDAKMKRREAYEGIRADVVLRVEQKVRQVAADVLGLFCYVSDETAAFRALMGEYGALRSDGQMSYTLQEGNFKVEVKTNKVKRFDERADLAADGLIAFLRAWIASKERGTEDPMYQLAMTLIERNKYGDLDYKSISRLYDLEEAFNSPEYSILMQMFRESHLVEALATNFYFWQKSELGVWTKLEVSFNRL